MKIGEEFGIGEKNQMALFLVGWGGGPDFCVKLWQTFVAGKKIHERL